MQTRPQAPSEDAVWEGGKWMPMIDSRDQDGFDCPMVNLDHPAPHVPAGNHKRVALYEALLLAAKRHFKLTGRHLQVYPDLADLYASITWGVTFERDAKPGQTGRVGEDHYVIKCIAPYDANDTVSIQMSDGFSHLAVVRITEDFQIAGCVTARDDLPGSAKGIRKLRWSSLIADPDDPTAG